MNLFAAGAARHRRRCARFPDEDPGALRVWKFGKESHGH